MTQEANDNKVVEVPETLEQRAARLLAPEEVTAMNKYLDAGGKKLAVETAAAFFQLFLNGSDVREIHRLNKPFPYEAILFERIKGDWDRHKEQYLEQLKMAIRDKLVKSNLEMVGLMTDMVAVASKQQIGRAHV